MKNSVFFEQKKTKKTRLFQMRLNDAQFKELNTKEKNHFIDVL